MSASGRWARYRGLPLLGLLVLSLACGDSTPEAESPALAARKALYVLLAENEKLCLEIALQCTAKWASGTREVVSGCTDYLATDGRFKRLQAEASLRVIERLAAKADLPQRRLHLPAASLAALLDDQRFICSVPSRSLAKLGFLVAEIRDYDVEFRKLQPRVLSELKLDDTEIDHLLDHWRPEVESEQRALQRYQGAQDAADRTAQVEQWRRFLELQRRKEREQSQRRRGNGSRLAAARSKTAPNLSAAYRRAVELAAHYLAGGPAAWWTELDEDAPLKSRPRDAALAEIGVRAGVPNDAIWSLLRTSGDAGRTEAVFATQGPSGRDGVLILELVARGGIWRIHSLRSWADRSAAVPSGGQQSATQSLSPATPGEELGELAELQDLLAKAPDPATASRIVAALPAGSPARSVGALWLAQLDLDLGDLRAAGRLLSVIEEPVPRPLHSVLLARLAALRGDPVSAALHYQNALGLLPEADSLSLEAADSLEQAGYPDLARGLLERLADQGTLESRVYYELAGREAAEGDAVLASEHLETAVDLQPIQRSAVVEDADLAKMVRELGLFDLLDLSTARRRAPRIQGLARAPAELPPDALATIRGELLEIEIGDSLLEVPGGAGLAPPSAQPEDPGEAREQEDRRLLAEIPEIEDLTRGAAGFLRPRERAELVALAGALERHNRWADLVSLTDDLASRPRQMPTALATLRADALRRLGRGDEAIALLTGVARSRVEQKRRDPQALYALGRQLAASGKFDQAISLTQRAEQESPEPPLVSRLPKIRLEARLARSALVYRSAHFEIRYPVETGDFYVKRLADVLEKERLRLRKWIPEEDGPRLEVSLFPSEDFFRAYSDARDLPASYDDVLRVPLADVPSLHPLVLTLVTHTLAHALVSRATHDQAPRWFQEGLAQHVQPIQNEVNPIADYQRLGTFLSLPLLDAALSGRSDPRLAQIAYDESVWAMHFLETRYGKAGISKLVRAFGEGMTTDEAFEQVLGASTEELDHRIWAWCVADAPAAWPTEEVRYDLSPPSGIRLSRNP